MPADSRKARSLLKSMMPTVFEIRLLDPSMRNVVGVTLTCSNSRARLPSLSNTTGNGWPCLPKIVEASRHRDTVEERVTAMLAADSNTPDWDRQREMLADLI